MDKITIEKEAIVLDKAEREKLIQCLNYCYHRLTQHSPKGLKVDIDFVEYMRKNI